MNTVSHILRRAWLAPSLSLVMLWNPGALQAQVARNTEFHRQGDVFSEKVSGFFGRVFNGGSRQQQPAPVYQQAPQSYGQRQIAAPQQPRYQQAPPPSGGVKRQTYAAARQQPVYRQAPMSSASASTAKRSTRTTSAPAVKHSAAPRTVAKKSKPEPRRGVYTSVKRNKAADVEPSAPKKSSTEETVLQAPQPSPFKEESAKTYTTMASSGSNNSTGSDLYSLPNKRPSAPETPASPSPSKETSTAAASGTSAVQEFPKGTATSKPGRVISPYEPNNELDVQGLPSGSLALDPTTQKVFKIP